MLRAVIFDVGGVLIRTRNRRGREKWAKRLGLDSWEFENFVFAGESGLQAQLGQKSFDDHWHWLGKYFKLNDTELAQMRQDFFAGDVMNDALVAVVPRLRQAGYKTGILSNFGNDARYVWREIYPFIEYFDIENIIISSEVGLMKPDPRIYALAAERVGVKMEEILFIDDFVENIIGAQKAGMQTLHFADPDNARQKLLEITGIA